MLGGYVMLNVADENIYVKAKNALTLGKPILFYEDANTCYYIDAISIDGDDNIILKKGGKTFTITDANSVIATGSVSAPTMEEIKDLNGNLRFIEDDGIEHELSGVTYLYNKWSLSGTHLMLVLSASIANGTNVEPSTLYSDYLLPKWVYDKIIPVFSTNILLTNITLYDSSYGTQTLTFRISKIGDNKIRVLNANATTFTLTADRTFRLQFDILIDAE